MKILYLTEDFIHTPVHHNLCNHISTPEIQVTIFSVLRTKGQSLDLRSTFSEAKYTSIVTPIFFSEFLYKYCFHCKIKTKFKRLIENINPNDIELCHASTLFTEGAIALKLYQQYGIPYIITIRGTDLYFYLKKMPFLWNLGKKIIANSKKVIFLTHNSYNEAIANKIINSNTDILKKSTIIPNGIDFNNYNNREIHANQFNNNILYIGRFDKNKNVIMLLKAFEILQSKYPLLKLNLVGGGGDHHNEVIKMVNLNPSINFLGEIRNKIELLKVFQENSILIMISHRETFGLVYLEALTKGLPIIYTRGQGFDGFFEDGKIGFSTNPNDIAEICHKMELSIVNYCKLKSNINSTCLDFFSWSTIASSYRTIYNEIAN